MSEKTFNVSVTENELRRILDALNKRADHLEYRANAAAARHADASNLLSALEKTRALGDKLFGALGEIS